MRIQLLHSALLCLAITACSDTPTAAPVVAHQSAEGLSPIGVAKVVINTIDATALVSQNGHNLIVTGPITCTAGESTELRLTVTQRSTAALAEGRGRVTCTGSSQQWRVQLSKEGSASFQEGAAVAVGLARTIDRGVATDAHQWLVNITLTK